MKTTRIVSLLLAIILILPSLSGCGKKGAALDDLEPTDELVIYYPRKDHMAFMQQYIMTFRAAYPEVNVKTVEIEGDEDYAWSDYTEQVVNDLLAGDGPDVLLLKYMPSLDVQKAARNHNFYDLTDLLASDPDFHEEDYLDGIFDAVKIRGRIYTMPRSIYSANYLSDRAKLEELGFSWDEIETTSDFVEELARLTPIAARDEAFQQMLEKKNSFRELFCVSGIRLLDYDREKVLPDEAEFRVFMESYKTFFPWDYDPEDDGWISNYRSKDLMQGDFVFWFARHFYDLNWNMRVMMDDGHECVLHAAPAQTGETVGMINTQLAIRANSKNVLNAYRFIRLACSEEIMAQTFWNTHQATGGGASITKPITDVPVRKNAIGAVIRGTFPWPKNYNLTEEEEDEIIRQYSSFDRFTVRLNDAVYDMLWKAMLPYLQDEKSYDECVTELKRTLTFYLSE